MTVSFTQAVRDNTKLLIGIAGPSSSGKTYSALLLATGIKEEQGGDIFFIDTESGRALHYADDFDFQHYNLTAPFSPDRYLEAIIAAEKASQNPIIVIDSMSHEHEGEGGLLEMHEQVLNRMAGNDYSKRQRMSIGAWNEPKQAHKKFMNKMLQIPAHLIFCFRAQEKMDMEATDHNNKRAPKMGGLEPIAAKRFKYEMTAMLILPAGSEGKPDTTLEAGKINGNMKSMFPNGVQLSKETGRKLAKWASGNKKPVGGSAEPSQQESGGDAAPSTTSSPLKNLTSLHDTLTDALSPEMVTGAASNFKTEIESMTDQGKAAARAIVTAHLKRTKGEIEAYDCVEQCNAILEQF